MAFKGKETNTPSPKKDASTGKHPELMYDENGRLKHKSERVKIAFEQLDTTPEESFPSFNEVQADSARLLKKALKPLNKIGGYTTVVVSQYGLRFVPLSSDNVQLADIKIPRDAFNKYDVTEGAFKIKSKKLWRQFKSIKATSSVSITIEEHWWDEISDIAYGSRKRAFESNDISIQDLEHDTPNDLAGEYTYESAGGSEGEVEIPENKIKDLKSMLSDRLIISSDGKPNKEEEDPSDYGKVEEANVDVGGLFPDLDGIGKVVLPTEDFNKVARAADLYADVALMGIANETFVFEAEGVDRHYYHQDENAKGDNSGGYFGVKYLQNIRYCLTKKSGINLSWASVKDSSALDCGSPMKAEFSLGQGKQTANIQYFCAPRVMSRDGSESEGTASIEDDLLNIHPSRYNTDLDPCAIANIENSKLLSVLNPIDAIVDECKLHVSNQGFKTTVVDPANVQGGKVEFSPEFFSSFDYVYQSKALESDNNKLGFPVDRAVELLRTFDPAEEVTFSVCPKRKVKIDIGRHQCEISTFDPDCVRKEPSIDQIEATSKTSFDLQELTKRVSEHESNSDRLQIVVSDGELFLYSENDIKDSELVTKIETTSDSYGYANSIFSINYISDYFSAIEPENGDTGTLVAGVEFPMKFTREASKGSKESMFLAPRVTTSDENSLPEPLAQDCSEIVESHSKAMDAIEEPVLIGINEESELNHSKGEIDTSEAKKKVVV